MFISSLFGLRDNGLRDTILPPNGTGGFSREKINPW